MIGVKGVVVRELRLVVMKPPYIDETYCAFGEELPVNPLVFNQNN
jgi:hypothetical protein